MFSQLLYIEIDTNKRGLIKKIIKKLLTIYEFYSIIFTVVAYDNMPR